MYKALLKMGELFSIRYSKSLLMVLFISMIVCSCSKEEEDTYFHHKISTNLYPLMFIQGSTWIYKNAGTSLFDTVVLTSVEIDTIVYGPSGPGQGSPGEEQVYVLVYNSSQFGVYSRTLREDFICRGWMVGGEPIGVEYLSSHKVGDLIMNVEIADIYNTYIVNGISYSNVVLMDVQNDGSFPGDMNLYYVDYVGIVKKEIKENDSIIETWELLEYNVVLVSLL